MPTPTTKKIDIYDRQNSKLANSKVERTQRSKSRKRKNMSVVLDDYLRDAVNETKRKKKIEVPEKYRNILDDLKNDRSETIDFGGAEIGDQNLLGVCEYIGKSSKLRNLKLVRNKLTDEVVYELLNACFKSKITSLNLGQNLLTEKCLDLFQKYDLGDIRYITLSLNKINRRNVK